MLNSLLGYLAGAYLIAYIASLAAVMVISRHDKRVKVKVVKDDETNR